MTGEKPNLPRLAAIGVAITAMWLIFAVFSTSEFYRRVGDSHRPVDGMWPDVLTFQLFSALQWAIFTPLVIFVAERLPVRKPHALRNLFALLAVTPVLSVVRAAFGGSTLQIASGEEVSWYFVKLSIAVRFGRWWLFIVVIVVITNYLLALRESALRERRTVAAQAEAAAVELAALRARVQPRFVLSTIESIKAQIATDPDGADRTIVALSSLLRRTLDHARRSVVTLADELDLVDRYIELERTRSGSAVAAHFKVDDGLLGARVPPLLLPTVLNGALFGRTDESDRLLAISGSRKDERLSIEVQCRPALAESETTEQTHARLRHIFGGEFGVRTEGDTSSTVITIDLPLQLEPAGRPA